MSRHREEVLNTTLAACIVARGMAADPETIMKQGHARPDVMVKFRGLRCAIEGKVDDVAQARAVVSGDARRRIDQGIAHLAVAVVYPTAIRSTDFDALAAEMSRSDVDFSVLTDAGESEWHSGGVDELLAGLRRAHESIVRDDVLAQAVGTLSGGLDQVAAALLDSPATCDRLIDLLGVGGKSDAADV